MILSVTQYRSGQVTLAECLLIIVLAADFFLPMRPLGSYFHIAMNGMAASEKNFPAVGPAGGTHAGGGMSPKRLPSDVGTSAFPTRRIGRCSMAST